MSIKTVIRLVGTVVVAIVALFLSFDRDPSHQYISLEIGIIAACAIVAFIITPYVTLIPYHWIREKIRHAAVSDLIAGAIGLIVGLCIAALTSALISPIRLFEIGQWLPILVAFGLAYICTAAAVWRKDDFARMFGSMVGAIGAARRSAVRDESEAEPDVEEREETPRLRGRFGKKTNSRSQENKILVDTSAIIDGRIADITETGFVSGMLVVPRFVLEELQHIADSADTMRRNRGRRGLDILKRLQKDPSVTVEISDADAENATEVDAKLVKLARAWHTPIITNDFNLNRVADLQGVKVLNINELAHAVKPILLPGEDMTIKIMQDGKEVGQGVGYLDDGTMIVVEGGKSYMGTTIDVTVTRVLQTVAGRMIFAHPKSPTTSGSSAMRRTGTA
ncbi:MAG: PIN domain nuclease [Chloroflexi bacterium]|nr:MAG: PIN domain nuclease [Chloroflexota bacterium]